QTCALPIYHIQRFRSQPFLSHGFQGGAEEARSVAGGEGGAVRRQSESRQRASSAPEGVLPGGGAGAQSPPGAGGRRAAPLGAEAAGAGVQSGGEGDLRRPPASR